MSTNIDKEKTIKSLKQELQNAVGGKNYTFPGSRTFIIPSREIEKDIDNLDINDNRFDEKVNVIRVKINAISKLYTGYQDYVKKLHIRKNQAFDSVRTIRQIIDRIKTSNKDELDIINRVKIEYDVIEKRYHDLSAYFGSMSVITEADAEVRAFEMDCKWFILFLKDKVDKLAEKYNLQYASVSNSVDGIEKKH